MPLVQVRRPQSKEWNYVVILPPAASAEDVLHFNTRRFLPVPTAQKIVHAIRQSEPCGEADGFAWQYDEISPACVQRLLAAREV